MINSIVLVIVGAVLFISGMLMFKDATYMRRNSTYVQDILGGKVMQFLGLMSCVAGIFIGLLGLVDTLWK
jgi:hypothetical protein